MNIESMELVGNALRLSVSETACTITLERSYIEREDLEDVLFAIFFEAMDAYKRLSRAGYFADRNEVKA